MPSFTLTEIKRLNKELKKFIVDEGHTLDKNEHNYVKAVMNAITYGSEGMNTAEPSEFIWPVAPQGVEIVPQWLQEWKQGEKGKEKTTQSTSGEGINAQAARELAPEQRTSNKRPAQESTEEARAPKRLRSTSSAIVDFHIEHLLTLLKDKDQLANRVVILQQALKMVNAGAKPKLVEWHINDIKKLLPEEEEILEAAELLIECIRFRDAC